MMSKESYKKWYDANAEQARHAKRENMRRYRMERPEQYNSHSQKAKLREREILFEMYGHVCVRCGFADKRALTLDHINNDGSSERALLGERGVYRKAKATHQPDVYQILCMNCQFIKQAEVINSLRHQEWLQQHGAY
jgi:hypothetical protein